MSEIVKGFLGRAEKSAIAGWKMAIALDASKKGSVIMDERCILAKDQS